MTNDYVQFTGEETEEEFLTKCLTQWDISAEIESEFGKMMTLGAMFSEMRARLEELKD